MATFIHLLNRYIAYYVGQDEDNDIGVIEDELCGIAQMDAWHDHKTITGLGSQGIKALVDGYTNRPNGPCDKPPGDEDAFMFSKLIVHSVNPKYCRVQSSSNMKSDSNLQQIDNIPGLYELKIDTAQIFTSLVANRYKVLYCDTKEPDYISGNFSLIQYALQSQGITENYYLIKDTAKSDYSVDLMRTGTVIPGQGSRITDQLAISLLTGPGIFDPGPTTTPFTGTGREQGFMDGNSNSKFGIIDFSYPNERIVHYPEWTQRDTYTKYEPVERLIYSKYDCKMVASTIGSIPQDYITKTNSTLYIKETVQGVQGTQSNVFYVNKTNSDKATDLSQLAFTEKFEQIGTHRFPPGTQFPYPEASYIATTSGPKKIFSKKVGDSGQALYTLRDRIAYKQFEPSNQTLSDTQLSNGIHGFVSYDRVAIVSSIFYGAPIVIFITDNGFVIYISQNLINAVSTPEAKYERMLADYRNKKLKIDSFEEERYRKIEIIKQRIIECIKYLEEFYIFVKSITDSFVSKIAAISSDRSRDNVKAKNYDKEYKLWLSKLYLYNQLSNVFGRYGISVKQVDDVNNFINAQLPTLPTLVTLPTLDILTTLSTLGEIINKASIIITKFEILNSLLDQLTLIYEEYNYNCVPFVVTEKFKAIDKDEKELNRLLKLKNPQIADSISSITFSQGLQNPNCLMSLFGCFGSSKMPNIGPIYEIYRFYQVLPQFITQIITAFCIFIKTIAPICRKDLYNLHRDYLISKVNVDESQRTDDMKQLSNTTIDLLIYEYEQTIPVLTQGGSKTYKYNRSYRYKKYNKNNNRRVTRKRKTIKGGNLQLLQAYLEFNSTRYLASLYVSMLGSRYIQSLIHHYGAAEAIPNIRFIINLSEYCNLIQEDINNEQYATIFEYQRNIVQNVKEQQFVLPQQYSTEITDFNLITNNIVGEFNFILLKIIIIFKEQYDIISNMASFTKDDYKNSANRLLFIKTEFIDLLIQKRDLLRLNMAVYTVRLQMESYKHFITSYTAIYRDDKADLKYEVLSMKYVLTTQVLHEDINTIFIRYLNDYLYEQNKKMRIDESTKRRTQKMSEFKKKITHTRRSIDDSNIYYSKSFLPKKGERRIRISKDNLYLKPQVKPVKPLIS